MIDIFRCPFCGEEEGPGEIALRSQGGNLFAAAPYRCGGLVQWWLPAAGVHEPSIKAVMKMCPTLPVCPSCGAAADDVKPDGDCLDIRHVCGHIGRYTRPSNGPVRPGGVDQEPCRAVGEFRKALLAIARGEVDVPQRYAGDVLRSMGGVAYDRGRVERETVLPRTGTVEHKGHQFPLHMANELEGGEECERCGARWEVDHESHYPCTGQPKK